MQVVVKIAPGTLPMAVSTALRHIRALEDDVDLVELYCRAATQAVEDYTGRALIQTVYTAQLDKWPNFARDLFINGPLNREVDHIVDAIALPRSPLVAIGSVKYYPSDGGAQAIWAANGNYVADIRSLPGRLVFVAGAALPAVANRADAIEIEFTAGHGVKESDIPPMLMMGVLQLARHFFDNPGMVDPMGRAKEMPYAYRMLLRSQRV